MNKLFVSCVFALLLAACSQEPASQANEVATAEDGASESQLHSGVLVENMETSVDPGNDFNAYVNGGWMATAEIAPDRASNTVGLEVHEEATENVRKIIEESAEGDYAKGSDEQKVGDLFASWMDMETRNERGVSPLQREFEAINALEDYTDLAVYFAEVNKLGVSTPFTLNQYVDFKNPDTYMMYTYQGGLGLPDREYYFDESERGKEIREKYLVHLEKMFDLAGLENGAAAAETIMALETRLAAEHMLKEETRNMVALYNKIPLGELPELMPDFAWDEYLEAAQVSFIDGLVVTQLDYTRALNDIITSTPMETWKTYLHWKVLNTAANLLSEDIDRQNFEFYAKTLNGVEQQLPMWKRGVALVNNNLGEVVGKVYVARHFPPEAKDRMMELVDN
ncbi:MAG: peptidase M13, partial [Xanthomonadales bacterium]|nr:peptidase M13 [Xanthomonadales bacterium]